MGSEPGKEDAIVLVTLFDNSTLRVRPSHPTPANSSPA